MHSLNFWTSREAGEAWYRERGAANLETVSPGVWSEEKLAAAWVDLHTFVTTVPAGDELREFRRRAGGPQESAS